MQVRLSADGRFLAATTWGSDVKLWELVFARDGLFKACSKAMELKGHTSGVLSIAFSGDSTRAVTASKDGTLRVWKLDVRCDLLVALGAHAKLA
jgi:transducin beta-like protein 2